MAEELVWVYGVVPRDAGVPAAPGVDASAVEAVRCGDLAALVSRVPAARYEKDALSARLEEMPEVEALARAHDGVLAAALEDGDVVPLRMCTLYESPASVERMLDERGGELRETLDRIRGRREWGAKAYLDAEPAAADTEAPRSGMEYLKRRREQRDRAVATREVVETAAAEVHARLAERAAAAVLARPHDRRLSGRGDMVLNGAYLVPLDGTPAFLSLADELRERHAAEGVALELTGPWPAYHFVGGAR